MTQSEKKIVQYLNEAHATEMALTRVLQEQIAMAPHGRYRSALERHLRETREHATRVAARRRELQGGGDALGAIVGTAQDAVGQMIALAKAPLDLVRGSGGEEKVLKNAKDACATEALEIATYIALESLARAAGDAQTAELAASIRGDEEAMLAALRDELPALARAVARADIGGEGSYDIADTGAADAVRDVAKGVVASASDLPIAGYDGLTAEQIVKRLRGLSQPDLTKVEAYERRTHGRATVLDRIGALRGDEPWAGYDAMTAGQIIERLRGADDALAARVRDHERAHKARATVLRAAQREPAHA